MVNIFYIGNLQGLKDMLKRKIQELQDKEYALEDLRTTQES